jgi:hypothetical protein
MWSIALDRKNALFATKTRAPPTGSAFLSPIDTAKLNSIAPQAWFAGTPETGPSVYR